MLDCRSVGLVMERPLVEVSPSCVTFLALVINITFTYTYFKKDTI